MAGDAKPKKMLIGGIVIMVIATIGGITFAVIGGSKFFGAINDLTNTEKVQLPGTSSVVGSGNQFTVWSSASFANCSVNGGEVNFDSSGSTEQSADVNGESFALVGWFDTVNGEDYSVDCDGTPGETFSVVELSFSEFAVAAAMFFGSFIGGFGLFFIGLIFTIIALFRRSSWTKKHGGQGGGYYPQQPGQPLPGQQAWSTAAPGAPAAPTFGAQPPPPAGIPPGPGGPPPFAGQAPPPGGHLRGRAHRLLRLPLPPLPRRLHRLRRPLLPLLLRRLLRRLRRPIRPRPDSAGVRRSLVMKSVRPGRGAADEDTQGRCVAGIWYSKHGWVGC